MILDTDVIVKMEIVQVHTLGPAYNEYGYYEHPVTTSNFLCTKFSPLTSMLKKSGYYEQIYLLSHLQWVKRSHCS